MLIRIYCYMKFLYPLVFILFSSVLIGQFPQELQDDFQTIIEERLEFYDAVGVSAAVRSGESTWEGVVGMSEENVDLTTEMTFGIGSVTKTITSAVIMDMWGEGLLHPDDSIYHYIQPFANINLNVTIHELLNHTSGIFSFTDHPDFFSDAFTYSNEI